MRWLGPWPAACTAQPPRLLRGRGKHARLSGPRGLAAFSALSSAAAGIMPAAQPSNPMPNVLLCIGAGFIGGHVCKEAMDKGYTVLGTTRCKNRAAELTKSGIVPIYFDTDSPQLSLRNLEKNLGKHAHGVTHVLSTVTPCNGADPIVGLLGNTLCERLPRLRWVGYVSSLHVYADTGLENTEDTGIEPVWIDEDSLVQPSTPLGKVRLSAETEWKEMMSRVRTPTGTPPHLTLFRPAPVYGAQKSPLESMRTGLAAAVERAGHVHSRVHVVDAARVIVQAMKAAVIPSMDRADDVEDGGSGAAGGAGAAGGDAVVSPRVDIRNVVDFSPAPPADVLREAARLLGMEAPPTVEYETIESTLSAPARHYWSNARRVRSRWVDRDTYPDSTHSDADTCSGRGGLKLLYPSYREGLEALMETQRAAAPAAAPAAALAAALAAAAAAAPVEAAAASLPTTPCGTEADTAVIVNGDHVSCDPQLGEERTESSVTYSDSSTAQTVPSQSTHDTKMKLKKKLSEAGWKTYSRNKIMRSIKKLFTTKVPANEFIKAFEAAQPILESHGLKDDLEMTLRRKELVVIFQGQNKEQELELGHFLSAEAVEKCLKDE